MLKVSVIVPIYNVELYIVRCIESVMAQSYSHIECLLINDCSPDNSIFIVQSLLKSYEGTIDFKIINREKNGGLSAARNIGISEATGDYIYFLDSDDSITPDCIAQLVSLADKHKGVDMVVGATVLLREKSQDVLGKYSLDSFPEYSDNKLWIKRMIFRRIPVIACNKLINRDFIISGDLIFKEGIVFEDSCWRFFIAKKITSIAFYKEITYNYYQRENSITNDANVKRKILSIYTIVDCCIEHINGTLIGLQYRDILKLLYTHKDILNTEELKQQYQEKIAAYAKMPVFPAYVQFVLKTFYSPYKKRSKLTYLVWHLNLFIICKIY